MDFDEGGDDIIFLLFIASGVKNVVSILPKSRRQLAWVKPWLQCRSKKNCLLQYYMAT